MNLLSSSSLTRTTSNTGQIIARTLSKLQEGSVQETKISQVHEELVNCLTTLEREIEEHEKLKTKQHNELSVLSAQITELTDRVEKARLRENDLTERVARWVDYLREEKEKVTVVWSWKKTATC
ncbi:hypothetical protein Y032_0020g67 [Ancylostoma ceylanicum]|uniref:Uncharacterized protein n=1 Tax=Ancylostoma ceylanicum TaxID=53326 RepID=A0A016V0M9_9BILA|nr:hypothetical protein Y032_0020g67 [Ancylostoma ceylanicum]